MKRELRRNRIEDFWLWLKDHWASDRVHIKLDDQIQLVDSVSNLVLVFQNWLI